MSSDPKSFPRHVLIVEDEPASRNAMRILLEHQGFIVTTVPTVSKAMTALSDTPACVVLDLMLPDGSGVKVLEYIRESHLPIRVAVATAVTDPEVLQSVEHLGADALYQKPFDLRQLTEWLNEC